MHWSRCKIRLGWERHRCQWMGFQHQLMGLTFLVGWVGRGLAVLSTGGQPTAQKFISWMILRDFTISNAATIGSQKPQLASESSIFPDILQISCLIIASIESEDLMNQTNARGFNFKKGSRDASTQSSLAITTREMFYITIHMHRITRKCHDSKSLNFSDFTLSSTA